MRKARCLELAGVGAALAAAAALAQEPKPMDDMPTPEMMSQCMQHCQATAKSTSELKATIAEARKSNDPAKMRAALGQVQSHLSATDQHMAGCMKMMGKGQRRMLDHSMMDHEQMQGGKKPER